MTTTPIALKFLQAGGHLVEFVHPARVRVRAWLHQGVEIDVLVPQPAKRVLVARAGL